MDSFTLIGVSIVLGVAFLITSQAKNKEGKKYGIIKMAQIWSVAVGLMGAHALLKLELGAEGIEERAIPLTPIILMLLPFFMIGSNILKKMKKNKTEQISVGNAD